MKKIFFLAVLVLLPIYAYAAEINSGEKINIESKQKNPIIFSNTAEVKSMIEGDLTVFSQKIKVDESIENSAYLFAGQVEVSKLIGNRLVIASAESKINSEVKGDLIAVGSKVLIDSSAKIHGDVIAYASEVVVKGQVNGNLRVGGSKIVLDGALINSNAIIQSEQIVISDTAQINQDLKYYSSREMSLPGDRVKGEITFTQLKSSKSQVASSLIGSMVTLMILGLVLLWLFKEKMTGLITNSTKEFGSVLLAGFLTMLIAPLIMMALLISYVGLYVFILVLILYIAAWLIGYAMGAIFLGYLIVRLISRDKNVSLEWSAIVFGSIAFILIGLIPFFGGIMKFVLTLFGAGIFIRELKRKTLKR